MAYQPKSYRKFVATAATATLVASAIAPVAGASSNFTDVAPKYKDAVDYLVANNITKGATATTFGTHDNIKRGDLAIWLAAALKLDTTGAAASGFVDTKGTRYDAAVSVLKAKGYINGKTATEFAPSAPVTRGEMAIMLSNAYDLKSDVATKFTDAVGNYKNAIQGLFAYGVTTGKTETTFGTSQNITRGDLAIFLKRAAEVVKTPEVVSATAANGKELVVKFNQAVDKTDALLLSKYSLTGETFTGATVSEDGKTVTLTVSDTIDVTNATLEIQPIKTKADSKVLTSKYVTLFSYKDTSAPVVASIEAKGTEAVVTFNEALATEGTVSLDGAVLSSTVSASSPYYVVNGKTLTVKNLVAEKSYKLDVVGAKDAAQNMSGQITVNFTVVKPVVDNSKPTVSSSVSGNKLTLSFSEEVTKGSVTVGGTPVAADKIVASEDKKTYTIDVQDAGLFGGTTFFTREVVVSGFADTASTPNTMEQVKFNATFTADTTAPAFVSASIKTLGKDAAGAAVSDLILLTFNDAVKAGDLSGTNELVIKSIDGIFQSANAVDLTSANVAYGYDVDGKDGIKGSEANVVAISFDAKEKSSYTFELAGKVVADTYNNKVADTVSFSAVAPEYSATPGTDAKDVSFTAVKSSNVDLTLQFNKTMSDSAVNAANYTLGGKALPAGSTVKFVDNRSKVVITLPQGSITANGTYALVGSNLTDTNGNTLVGGKVTQTLALSENVVPAATTVTLADSKNFTVDFSEVIYADAAVAGVTVKVNGTTLAADKYAATVVSGDLKVTTVDNLKATDSITVEFKDTNLRDANGNKVANSTVSK